MALGTVKEALLLVGLTIAWLSVPTHGCTCVNTKPQFLQDIYCQAKFVIQAEIKKNMLQTPNGTNLTRPPLPPPVEGPPPPGIPERMFDIKTIKVYRTSPEFNAVSDKNSLYTAFNSAACGVNLGVGNQYIISGDVRNGKLRLHLCRSFWRKVNELTDEQLRGLSYVYDRSCKDCQIDYCRGSKECLKMKFYRKSCLGNQDGPVFKCYDKYATCEVSQTWFGAACIWEDINCSDKLEDCLKNKNRGH